MLVDADAPIEQSVSPRQHIQNQHGCDLKDADDEQCHLMVQLMEAWFTADHEALQSFYGKGFNVDALPKHSDVEQVSKDTIMQSLKSATRRTQKGEYHKIKHGAELLE